jgi:hypothetical protein
VAEGPFVTFPGSDYGNKTHYTISTTYSSCVNIDLESFNRILSLSY